MERDRISQETASSELIFQWLAKRLTLGVSVLSTNSGITATRRKERANDSLAKGAKLAKKGRATECAGAFRSSRCRLTPDLPWRAWRALREIFLVRVFCSWGHTWLSRNSCGEPSFSTTCKSASEVQTALSSSQKLVRSPLSAEKEQKFFAQGRGARRTNLGKGGAGRSWARNLPGLLCVLGVSARELSGFRWLQHRAEQPPGTARAKPARKRLQTAVFGAIDKTEGPQPSVGRKFSRQGAKLAK